MNADKQKIELTNNNIDAERLVLLYFSCNHYEIISFKDKYIFTIYDDLEELDILLSENRINISPSQPFIEYSD